MHVKRYFIGLTAVFLFISTANAESDVYSKVCSSCHEGGFKGLISVAPKTGKASDWEEYFANGLATTKQQVLDGSGEHASMAKEEGLNQDQVNEAVDYILSATEIKPK